MPWCPRMNLLRPGASSYDRDNPPAREATPHPEVRSKLHDTGSPGCAAGNTRSGPGWSHAIL